MFAKWQWTGIVAMTIACLVALPPGGADAQKKKKVDPEKAAAEYKAKDIEEIVTAYQLKEFGEKFKSPEALITAAGLLRKAATVKLGTIAEQPSIEDDKGTKIDLVPKGTAADSFEDQANDLFDQASALAGQLKLSGVDQMIKLAKEREYKQPGERGVVGGPRAIQRVIKPAEAQVFHFKFESHQACAIGFRGSVPMAVTIVRSDNDTVWSAGTFLYGVYKHVPGSGPNNKVPVTVRIRNVSPLGGTYQLFVN